MQKEAVLSPNIEIFGDKIDAIRRSKRIIAFSASKKPLLGHFRCSIKYFTK
jgi:hypothetical protein